MQSVWVKIVCTKRFFNLSVEVIINVHNARLCARCAIILLRINRIPFLSFCQWFYTFEESPKSIQDVIGDVYYLGKFCFNREKCESLGGYITTPRSIYGCGKCGAWLFVHKVPIKLQEHVNTTKTDKTRFFFGINKMNLLPDKQLFIKLSSRNNSPPITVTRTKKV